MVAVVVEVATIDMVEEEEVAAVEDMEEIATVVAVTVTVAETSSYTIS
jgi:hypothetical protein